MSVIYLLVPNREFSLGLHILLAKRGEFLQGNGVKDGQSELDVALGVFMSRIDPRVVRQRGESLVQGFVHFFGGALEEAPAPCAVSTYWRTQCKRRAELPPMKRVSPVNTILSTPSWRK
jgi:hypothetical protein